MVKLKVGSVNGKDLLRLLTLELHGFELCVSAHTWIFSVVNPIALHGLQFPVINILVLHGTADVQGPLSTHREGRLQVVLGALTAWSMSFSSQLCKDTSSPQIRTRICDIRSPSAVFRT